MILTGINERTRRKICPRASSVTTRIALGANTHCLAARLTRKLDVFLQTL
jgi:hypothetical protein